jgi:septal ring factor EnvC (AmiA/AmiB activator)
MKKQVDGHKHLFKDETSGVIVNRDQSDRERYRVAKQQAWMNKNSQIEIDELKKDVKELSGLKEEIEELKDLLKALLNQN